MITTDQVPADTGNSIRNVIKARWLSPRRKRFWAIVVILLYTLLGFFAAPLIIRNNITALLQDELGRPTHIERIEVNPYALSLRMQGFEMADTDGVKLAAFDELYINFQFLSLLKWAWTFSQIQLTGPYFYFERFDSGESRLDRLLLDFAKTRPTEAPGKKDSGQANDIPRLLIRNLGLSEGHVDVRDNLPETAVELPLSPINISIQELSTLPNLHGRQSVTIHLPGKASLKWSGSLGLAPLDSKGELVLEGLHLDPAIAYLEALLPLESVSATLSSRFQYYLREDNSGIVKIDIDELDVTLNDLLVYGLTPASEFIDIPEISLIKGKLRYPEQSLFFAKLGINNPRIVAWVNENGSLSLMDLIPASGEQTETTDTDSPGLPWQLGFGEFALERASLAFTDKSIQPSATINLTELQANVTGISNGVDVIMPFELSGKLLEGGNYSTKGKLGILPELSILANASTNGIPLSLGQSYVEQFAHIAVEDGVLNSAVEISLAAGQNIAVTGSVQIPALKINDTLDNEKLLGWEALDIDRFDLNTESLQFSKLAFKQPFGRIVIHDDLTTNLSALVVEKDTEISAASKTESLNVTIGGIRVDDGSMDFSDFSLPLPFLTSIANLDGTISSVDTNSTEPAIIKLEGQVDEYGLARIEGAMNMLDPIGHTDVTVEFRNLLMSKLSPYTVAFAGRQIDQGKLDLDLVYSIEEGLLHGANDVVLSDLVLGEKVDHPDAVSLPLSLAVSLLKDADGVIKIDLPVEGDINDPEFRIGGVVWQAVTTMITKIISAPFRLLGNLIGVDSEDFGQFEFLAGRADLTPPQLEKIVQLEQALQQRPELRIEINGVIDRVIDVPALQQIRLRAIANERLDGRLGDQPDDTMMLDEETRSVVEILFAERFPEIPTQSLKTEHTVPPADNPEGKPLLDKLAYAFDLWDRLLASELISDQDLANLATARAQVIRMAFLASGQIDGERIVIAAPTETESGDGQWVKLELAVASD